MKKENKTENKKENKTENKIYIVGDLHGDLKYLSARNWVEGKTLTKNDVLIQLGDFGILWDATEKKSELYWMEWLSEKPWTTLVVAGNHENWDSIESLPISEKWGGKVYEYFKDSKLDSIYFAVPGEIYTINDRTFLAIPKALSIDKHLRQEGRSWWPNELLSKSEETNTLDNLDEVNWKVDYLLSHAVADSVVSAFLDNPNSQKFNDPVSRFLEFVCNKLEFKANFFGHYHNNRTFIDASGDYYKCLWGPVETLDEDKILKEKAKWALEHSVKLQS